jgi:hypothetical protein
MDSTLLWRTLYATGSCGLVGLRVTPLVSV